MVTTDKIIEDYKNSNIARKEHYWIMYRELRSTFDNIDGLEDYDKMNYPDVTKH